MKNLAFHLSLGWKMIMPPILTGRIYFVNLGVEGLTAPPPLHPPPPPPPLPPPLLVVYSKDFSSAIALTSSLLHYEI